MPRPVCSAEAPWRDRLKAAFGSGQSYQAVSLPGHRGTSSSEARIGPLRVLLRYPDFQGLWPGFLTGPGDDSAPLPGRGKPGSRLIKIFVYLSGASLHPAEVPAQTAPALAPQGANLLVGAATCELQAGTWSAKVEVLMASRPPTSLSQ